VESLLALYPVCRLGFKCLRDLRCEFLATPGFRARRGSEEPSLPRRALDSDFRFRRKLVAQDQIADPARDQLIEPQQGPRDTGQIRRSTALPPVPEGAVIALLRLPNAVRRVQGVDRGLAVGPHPSVTQGLVHEYRRHDPDVNPLGLQFRAETLVESLKGKF